MIRFPDRHYVRVSADFDKVGSVFPRAIIWEDGRRFPIDAIQSFRPAASLFPGLSGDVYKVLIRGEEKYLFFSPIPGDPVRLGRWWVAGQV